MSFDPSPRAVRWYAGLYRLISRYHQHEVVGWDNLPDGPFVLVVNHSLATYDIALLCYAIYQQSGRVPRSLGDRAIFKIPGVRAFATGQGMMEGHPDTARDLLRDGQIVCVAPGGMLESLRSSHEKYELRWDKRKGFVRLALDAEVPIVLAACPRADDLFDVSLNPVTPRVYERLHLPLPIGRGVSLSPIPRPLKLVHFLDSPLNPPNPASEPAQRKHQVDDLHRLACQRMEALMDRAFWETDRLGSVS